MGREVLVGFSSFPRTTSCTLQQLRGNSGLGGAEPLFSIPGQLNFQHWKYFQVPWAGSNHWSMHMIIFSSYWPCSYYFTSEVPGKYCVIYIFHLGHSDE